MFQVPGKEVAQTRGGSLIGDVVKASAGAPVRQKWYTGLVAAVVAGLVMGGAVGSPARALAADSIAKTLAARVTILKWSKFAVEGGAATVRVTEADVRKGYVDLEEPTRLSVLSNAPGHYFAEIVPTGGFVKALQVVVDGQSFAFGAQGGGIPFRGTVRAPSRNSFEIHYRIYLAEGVKPGSYAWAPSVTVTVL